MNTLRTRPAAPTLIATLCFLATVAAATQQTNNADGQAMSQGSSNGLEHRVSASTSGQTLTTVTLTDASFNGMPAVMVSAPGGWHIQGQEPSAPAQTCRTSMGRNLARWPEPDNRAASFGWRWGKGVSNGNGCIPLTGSLTAADFLQKFAARLKGVRVVGPMPVEDALRMQEEKFMNNGNNQNSRITSRVSLPHHRRCGRDPGCRFNWT